MSYTPILIASPKRSGTTLIAWLLHLHGVWIGKAGVTKAPETNPQVGTENTAVKDYLKLVSGVPSDFREQIESRVKSDRPWLVKTPQNLYKREAWLTHYPEARWVLPKRKIGDVVDSFMRHPGMKGDRDQFYHRVADQQALQYAVACRAKHHWVDVDRLANTDEEEGRKLVEFCGVGPLNTKLFHEWVNPERWHGTG